jgi:hypothetical protein
MCVWVRVCEVGSLGGRFMMVKIKCALPSFVMFSAELRFYHLVSRVYQIEG